jgi:putative addiction module component (TIGR02574 family)
MARTELLKLLKLPAGERAEIAIALWDSLTDEQRDTELELGPEERAELDRRWEEHVAEPGSAVPWQEVRRKLRDGT